MALPTHSPSPYPEPVPLTTERVDPRARALSMAHHPTAAAVVAVASFADTVQLLTGPWRVDDPVGFAHAMVGAPMIAGHPVLDLAEPAGYSPDPWSIRFWATVRALLGGLATRRALPVARVSAEQAGKRITEARALAPAAGAEDACFVVAHLVDELTGPGRRYSGADPSWIVVVVGDRDGGVRTVVRARLADRVAVPLRTALSNLRERLAGADGTGEPRANDAVVVPFRTR